MNERSAASADKQPDASLLAGPRVSMVEVLSWLGQGKWLITKVTAAAAVASLVISLLTAPIFTARTSMLPPGNQQQSGSAAALAALGSLGGLAGGFSTAAGARQI